MKWNKAVLKIGSALIAPDNCQVSGKYLLPIASFISHCRQQGKEIILVSSGSVAAGRNYIEHVSPPSIVSRQAMAAVGQMKMMENWIRFFDFPCAQLLITHDDLKDRKRYVNIKNTLRELSSNCVLPIVNENDTVATQELKVGDNDNLAAQVALVAEADALFICSDIDGLFDKDPKKHADAQFINEVPEINDAIFQLAGDTTNSIATGGMKTKLQAAEKATSNGIDTLIFNGFNSENFSKLSADALPGTWFKAQKPQITAKKHWMQHTLKANGSLVIDAGAVNALQHTGASLLPSGITHVNGDFLKGEAITIINSENQLIAKGISQYNAQEMRKIQGKNSKLIEDILGYCPSPVAIHRDDLVLHNSQESV